MKALVVGGDGLIGRALAQALRAAGHSVAPTSRRGSSGALSLDLAGPLPDTLPDCDVACFCAAMTGFAACRAAPELSERVNVSAPAVLARSLAARGARVILLSTSAVFDCEAPHMAPERPYAPRGVYGAQKARAETAFLDLGPRATVLRLSRVFGEHDARIEQWTRALRSGERVQAVEAHTVSPVGLYDVVRALSALVESSEGGIYQASGAEDWSYVRLATEIAVRLKAPPHLVQSRSAREAGIPPDEVTRFTSLDCTRLTRFCGFKPAPAGEVLDYLLPQQRAMR